MIYVYKLVQIDMKKLFFFCHENRDLGQKWSHISEKGLNVLSWLFSWMGWDDVPTFSTFTWPIYDLPINNLYVTIGFFRNSF